MTIGSLHWTIVKGNIPGDSLRSAPASVSSETDFTPGAEAGATIVVPCTRLILRHPDVAVLSSAAFS